MIRHRMQRRDPQVRFWIHEWQRVDQACSGLLLDVLELSIRELFERYPKLESFRISVQERQMQGKKQVFVVVGGFCWRSRHPGQKPAIAQRAHQEVRQVVAAHYQAQLRPFLHNLLCHRDIFVEPGR